MSKNNSSSKLVIIIIIIIAVVVGIFIFPLFLLFMFLSQSFQLSVPVDYYIESYETALVTHKNVEKDKKRDPGKKKGSVEVAFLDVFCYLLENSDGERISIKEKLLLKKIEKNARDGIRVIDQSQIQELKEMYAPVLNDIVGNYKMMNIVYTEEEGETIEWVDKWGIGIYHPYPKGFDFKHENNYNVENEIFAKKGTPVVAIQEGEVQFKGWTDHGKRIAILSGDKRYTYGRLDRYADGIKKGHKVKTGEVIGYTGSTGYGILYTDEDGKTNSKGGEGNVKDSLYIKIGKVNKDHKDQTDFYIDPYPYIQFLKEMQSRAKVRNVFENEEDYYCVNLIKDFKPYIYYGGGDMLWPSPGYTVITSPFGNRFHPIHKEYRMHNGIDIGVPLGKNIVAAEEGIVVYAGIKGGYGKVVYIDHGDGIQTRYAHNSKLLVSKGDKVMRGELIAKSGSTGISTGAHLHFEIRVNGKAQNPLNWVELN